MGTVGQRSWCCVHFKVLSTEMVIIFEILCGILKPVRSFLLLLLICPSCSFMKSCPEVF